MGFDFGHVNGKRFSSNNSWVADENAWKGPSSTPISNPQIPLTQTRTFMDRLKDFGSGIGSGLRKVAEPYRNESINMFDVVLKDPKLKESDRIKYQAKKDALLKPGFQPYNTSGNIGDAVGQLVGNAPAFAFGGAATEGIAKGILGRFAPKLAPKVAPWAEVAVKSGSGLAPVGLMESERLQDIPENVAKNFAIGAGFGVGGKAAGIALKPVGNAISKGVDDVRGLFKPLGVPSAPIQPSRLSTPPVAPRAQPNLGGPLNRFQVRPDLRVPGSAIPKPLPVGYKFSNNTPPTKTTLLRKDKITTPDNFPFPTKDIPIVRYQKEVGGATYSEARGGTWYSRVNNIHGENTGYNAEGKTVGGMHQLKEDYTPRKPLLINDTTSPGAGQAAIQTIKGESYLDDVYNAYADGPIATKSFLKEKVGLSETQAVELMKHPDQPQILFDRIGTELAKKAGYDSIVHTTPNGLYAEVVKLSSIPERIKGINGPIKLKPRELGAPPLTEPTITPRPQQPIGELKIVNERRFAQNVRDSQVAPGEVKSNLDRNQLTYEPITNKETLNKANTIVEADAKKARELFDAPSKGISADDVALGESLIVKAIKGGDVDGANKLIADLAEKLTTAGQAVQAASIFKRLTPEGMLLYAQRVVNSTNKDLLERLGKKAPKVVLTPEDSKFITDTMTRVQKLSDGDEKNVAMAQVMKLISEKVPPSRTDQIKALQRISLLLNPKTMDRNILGNTIFGAIDNVSNVVATPIDMLTSKLLKTPRTTTLPSPLGQLKSMGEGIKLTARDAKLGIDTYHNKTQYEFSGKTNFPKKDILSRTLNKLDRATITGLKFGDTPFHKAAYDDVLRQQMKLAKVDKPTQAMMDQAQKIADQRTYQDVNEMTEAFKMAQKALNKVSSAVGLGNAEFGLGNFVTPFVKTPANILKRAVEYSPVGITTAIKEATKFGKGKFDQKAFVDSISRSVTGTSIIMVGYDLAKRGMITGSGNKDKDVASFERGLGKNDYAYKYGDNLYTYDWMQPGSMAIAIGADIYIKGKDRKQAENVVIDAIKSGGETLFKQSLLQGITRFMSGYSPMDNVATTAMNAPTQFIPTISKQISQLKDPLQRSTYAPTKLEAGGNLLKARIPGMTKSLEPKINTSGETMQTFQGKNNLTNIFFNPGSATTFKPNEVQKEILRLYETTGDKTIFPRVAPKSITVKGETIKLTPKEMTSFQQTLGKTTEARMKALLRTKQDDEKRVKEMEDAIEKAYDDAKMNLFASRGIKK
jgi:hypothetical protein